MALRTGRCVRLVVCSTLAVARECLRARLEAEPDLDVVGEAADCAGAVALASELRPDVLLLEAHAPGFLPTRVVPAVAATSPATRVVVLARKDDPRAPGLLQLGVGGYLSEEATVDDLLAALRAGPSGAVVDAAVAQAIALASGAGTPTARQLDVLWHVAQGESNRAIADRLGVAERTVEFHLGRLFLKVGAASRTELVTRARERGWVA